MWAAVTGFVVGRGLRNAGAPESAKEVRYQARQARRERRPQGHLPLRHAPGARRAWDRPAYRIFVVGGLAVAVLVLAVLALTR